MEKKTCEPLLNIYQDCKNPILFLLEEVKEIYQRSTTFSSFSKTLDFVLTKGLVVNDCDLCCWKCYNGYKLRNILDLDEPVTENQINYLENPSIPINEILANNEECCRSIYSNVESYLKYAEAVGITELNLFGNTGIVSQSSSCCNEFQSCLNLFIENSKKCYSSLIAGENIYDIIEKFIEIGVIEFLPRGIESQVCLIYDWLKEYTNDGCFAEIFYTLIVVNGGLEISCNENGTMIFAKPDYFSNV